MAHTYIVTSMITQGALVQVSGTVDGTVVEVYYPSSKTFANVLLFQAYVQPLMLAAVPIPIAGLTGTWTA